MANARVARGRKTQTLLAEAFQARGWPDAEAVAAALPGRDIRRMLGLAPEVKATSKNPILDGLRQAARYADGDLPFVVWRPDGAGPAVIDTWPAAFRAADAAELLTTARSEATTVWDLLTEGPLLTTNGDPVGRLPVEAAGLRRWPFVVWRPNGYGLDVVHDWPVLLQLGDAIRLLHAAGYGQPDPTPGCEECGNDDAAAGFKVCLDCLEAGCACCGGTIADDGSCSDCPCPQPSTST